ncbi:MAG: hypothetical protein HYT76_01430 [Deltaproteobacteria bacterium]|nr:hypothetical protein [Deltaproteobacteria bacterium]
MAVRGPGETYYQTPTLARPEYFGTPFTTGELLRWPPSQLLDVPLSTPASRSVGLPRISSGFESYPFTHPQETPPALPVKTLSAGETLGIALSVGALATTFVAPRYGTPLMIGAMVFQFFWPAQAEAQEREKQWRPASCEKEKTIKEEPYWVHIAIGSVVGGIAIRFGLVPHTKFFQGLFKDRQRVKTLLFGKEWEVKPYHNGFWNKNPAMRFLNWLAHHWGAIALPTVAIEIAARKAVGYEHELSPLGGLTLMLFWNRIGTQHLGADKSGSHMLLIIDRLYDVMIQHQSSQPLNDTNWWYVANRYGAISLVCGSYRARHLRDWLSKRRSQKFLRSVWVESGEGRSPTLVYEGGLHKVSLWGHQRRAKDYQWWMKTLDWVSETRVGKFLRIKGAPHPNLERRLRDNQARLISEDESQLVKKLLASSNQNNTVWVDEMGRLCERDTGRVLGDLLLSERRARLTKLMGGPDFASLKALGSDLSPKQRDMLTTMMGGTEFSSLFTEGVGTGVVRLGAQRFRQVKIGSQFGGGGFMLYWFLQEVATAPVVIGAAWLLCGEDLWQNAQFSIIRAPLTIPRLFLRYRLGVDTAPAMIFDRVWKYATEPYISKMFPLLASQGLFRKKYHAEAICADSLDQFANYHIGPHVVHGGLGSYNRHVANLDHLAETVAPLLKRVDFSGPSPYSPVGISYQLLAKYYVGEQDGDYTGLSLEEVGGVEHHLGELIEEAKRRLRGEVRRELLTYQDSTVIELAMALSVAAYYANYQDHKRFERLVQEHQDWFRQFESVGKDLDTLEDYVDSISSTQASL